MIEAVLRLYPQRYRLEAGDEIVAAYRESVDGVRAVDRLREAADIAGHALRMRLGVTSSSTVGQLLAAAAPQVAGVAAAYCGLHLSRWYVAASLSPAFPPLDPDSWTVRLFASAVVAVGAVTALTGRWRAGAWAAVVGLVAYAVATVASGPAFGDPVVTPVMALLAALVLAAAPPDLPPGARDRVTAGVTAAAVWVPVTALYAGVLPVSTDYGLWPLLVLAACGVAGALRQRSLAVVRSAAIVVACPLFLAYAHTVGP
ncbi:hypothetical protein ACH4KU_07085 [Streptomyces althioticus]|uniref:hypothetical protein n=1 Tax=Streptomyces althioticus TaxID=83380 RepID=UPI00340EA986